MTTAFDLNTAWYLLIDLARWALLCGFGIAVASVVMHGFYRGK